VKGWKGSERKFSASHFPVYTGGEISLGLPKYVLKSNIPQLDGLHMTYLGTNIGVVLANPIGKIKGTVGIFFSEPSVPYTMTLFQEGVSSNLYLLRLVNMKFHSLEPYTTLGMAYQQTLFYGNYLGRRNQENSNNSTADQKLIGVTGFAQINVGAGVEYQLQDYHNFFIHIFAEVNYGHPLLWQASNSSFSGTRANNPMMISAGFSLGIVK